jgi:hypothetical protein
MSRFVIAVAVALAIGASAIAFISEQLIELIGPGGKEVVRSVETASAILGRISTPSIEEIVKNRERIARDLKTDLPEQTDAIEQNIRKMDKKPLSLSVLDDRKRARLLSFFPADQSKAIADKNELDLQTIANTYAVMAKTVLEEAIVFVRILYEIEGRPSEAALNSLGSARGSLTVSLGRLIQFAGHLQELAFAPAARLKKGSWGYLSVSGLEHLPPFLGGRGHPTGAFTVATRR